MLRSLRTTSSSTRLGRLVLLGALLATVIPDVAGAATPVIPRRFADLNAAVNGGVVDSAVASVIREGRSVEALVSVDPSAELAAASKAVAPGDGSATRIARSVAPKLNASKAAVLSQADDGASLVQHFTNLPTNVVRFDSEDAVLDVANATDTDRIALPQVATVEAAQLDTAALARIGQTEAQRQGFQGQGTYTAVLDTGADWTQPAFACSASNNWSSCRLSMYEVARDDGRADDNGHGTNVAAIVSAVAPQTRVLAFDVFDGANASELDILKALNQVIGLKAAGYDIRSVNMSIGGAFAYNAGSCASTLEPTFAALRRVGIVPVVAAGNYAYRNGQMLWGVSWPACTSGALSVGATYARSTGAATFGKAEVGGSSVCTDAAPVPDQVACFSQAGPSLSLLAPGAFIEAGGRAMSGTSQAAPHVAGALAVAASAKRSASAYELESVVTTTGTVVRDGRTNFSYRRLDVAAAVAALVPATAVTTAVSCNQGSRTLSVRPRYTGANGQWVASRVWVARWSGTAWVWATATDYDSRALPTAPTYTVSPGSGAVYVHAEYWRWTGQSWVLLSSQAVANYTVVDARGQASTAGGYCWL
jgi:hypothetical protein